MVGELLRISWLRAGDSGADTNAAEEESADGVIIFNLYYLIVKFILAKNISL